MPPTPGPLAAVALVEADIVVTAAGAGHYLVTSENVAAALKLRRQRPMLLIDGAVSLQNWFLKPVVVQGPF